MRDSARYPVTALGEDAKLKHGACVSGEETQRLTYQEQHKGIKREKPQKKPLKKQPQSVSGPF